MTKKIIVSRIATMCASALLLFSCDKEISDVGGEVLTGSNIFNTRLDGFVNSTKNISLESIQSNDFSGNRFLGTVTRENTSGSVNYGLLYQVEPTTSTALTETSAGQTVTSITIKSATLILPYTYNLLEASTNTVSTYEIADTFTEETNSVNVEVFKSNHDLKFNSTETNSRQLYFANATTRISGEIRSIESEIEAGGEILNELLDVTPTSEAFEIPIATTDDENQVSPIGNQQISNSFEQNGRSFRVSLRPDFLGENFADNQGVVIDPVLFTTDFFTENFKGIYLKPAEGNEGIVAIDHTFNRVQPKIEITFDIQSSIEATDEDQGNETSAPSIQTNEVTVDFAINQQLIVSTITSNNTGQFSQASLGTENMVIKSGVSASSIALFEDASQLEEIFNQEPIINSAVLRLYVDVDSPLYDADKRPQNLWINTLQSGDLVSGAELIEEGEAVFYEFQITQYLRNILNVDDTEELLNQNFDLVVGVSTSEVNTEIVSQNQMADNLLENVFIFDPLLGPRINVASLLSLQEVPLFGSGAADQTKRPQLIVDFVSIK